MSLHSLTQSYCSVRVTHFILPLFLNFLNFYSEFPEFTCSSFSLFWPFGTTFHTKSPPLRWSSSRNGPTINPDYLFRRTSVYCHGHGPAKTTWCSTKHPLTTPGEDRVWVDFSFFIMHLDFSFFSTSLSTCNVIVHFAFRSTCCRIRTGRLYLLRPLG